MTQGKWEKIIGILLAAILAVLAVLGWVISPTLEQPEARVREKISIDARDDAYLYNGADLYLYSDGHSTQMLHADGATGAIDSEGTLTAAADVFTVAEAPAAGAGGDLIDLTDTFAIADGSDTMIGLDVNLTGANHTGMENSMVGVDLGLTTPDSQVPEKGLLVNDTDWDYAIDTGDVPIFSSAQTWMEDFLGDTLATEIVLLNGSDAQAVDPALSQGQYGLVVMVAGDSNASCAADCSEMALGLHWSADQHSLIFETRVHVEDITTVHMCVGMSDSIGLEMPATFTTDTPAAVADDFVGFCFDTDATTDEWWFIGIDGTTVATGVAAVGVAPANGVFQVLRVEIDAAGEAARGYIDGSLVGTLTANAITVTDLLSPIAVVQSLTTATRTLTVDYVHVGAQRQ